MDNSINFSKALDEALTQKTAWFDSERLITLQNDYRLLYTCVKIIDDMLEKKSVITQDPYKYEHQITEVVLVDNSNFTDQEMPNVMGSRLSLYEQVLDYLCTYFRFAVEAMSIQVIKKMTDFNATIAWNNLATDSPKPNTRGLAVALSQVKMNAQAVNVSLINDNSSKCAQALNEINQILSELAEFQKELYKGRLRKDIFDHPDFNAQKAFSSPENELAEIKRLYAKVIGKKSFYSDLVQEIINEDQGENRENLRANVLKKLEIPKTVTKTVKKGPSSKELLMVAVTALGALGPILDALEQKLVEDFELLFYEKMTFFKKLIKAIKKSFGIPEKERTCNLPVVNKRDDTRKIEEINVTDFLAEISSKIRIYSAIISRGSEYNKLKNASEAAAINFIAKQVTENNRLFTLIDAFDDYFKANVDNTLKVKLKGLKIDLSSYRNAIINLNKKKEDYISFVEESEQMKKLGITENA